MKISKPILILVFCSILINCSKDGISENKSIPEENSNHTEEELNEPSSTRLFTFKTEDSTEDFDNWLVIHDQNGKLLAYSSYEKSAPLVIEVNDTVLTSTNTLTATKLRYSTDGTKNYFWISSYTGLEIGSIIDENATLSNKTGPGKSNSALSKKNIEQEYTLKLDNINNSSRYSISSLTEGIVSQNYKPVEGSSFNIPGTNLVPNKEYFISAEDGNNQLKYKYFNAPESSQEIDLNFLDFNEYDRVVSVRLPEYDRYYATVEAYKENVFIGESLITSHEFVSKSEAIKEKTELGYINDFNGSLTTFKIYNENYTYAYTALDTIPESIIVPDLRSFTILDNSISNFKFETDSDYNVMLATFQYEEDVENAMNNQTRWTIYKAINETAVIGEIPQEIQDKYPNMNLEFLEYHQSTLLSKGHSKSDFYRYLFASGYNPSNKILVAEEFFAE